MGIAGDKLEYVVSAITMPAPILITLLNLCRLLDYILTIERIVFLSCYPKPM